MNYPARLYVTVLLFTAPHAASAGSVTLTTYYPAPTGNYDQLTANNIGIGTLNPLVRLDVRGGVKPGDQTTTTLCYSNVAGTMRYNNNGIPRMEFCNGSSWQAIGKTTVFQDHLPHMPRPPDGLAQWPNYIACPSGQEDDWILPLSGVSVKGPSTTVHYVVDLSSVRLGYGPAGDVVYTTGLSGPCATNNIATLCKDHPDRCIF